MKFPGFLLLLNFITSLPSINAFAVVPSSSAHPSLLHHAVPPTVPPLKMVASDSQLVDKSHKLGHFAGLVVDGIKERFGEEEAKKVIESWTLLDQGYEHKEFVGPEGVDPSTSNMHQLCHSYVPGLTCKPWWDVNDFKWCKKLASKSDIIRKEFLQATKDMEKLKKEGNNVWAGALTDDATAYGEGWKTLVLYDRGTWDPQNMQLFPKTTKAIRDCNIPLVEVFYASMKGHTDIKMHSDFTNFVITSHLALEIPESGNNKCRITVGDETRQWINGEVTLFDTSIMHDAINETDDTRYILMFRVWHPELTEIEQQALQFVYDCLLIPELVSTDPGERFMAEERIKIIRAFPVFKTGAGFGGGKPKTTKKKKKR